MKDADERPGSAEPPHIGGLTLWILTEGDVRRGLGHLSRCSGFADQWTDWGGRVQWVVDGDDAAQAVLDGRSAEWVSWQTNMPFAADLDGQIVVVDSYSASDEVLATVSEAAARSVFLDDTLRTAYPRGLAVNSTPGDLGALPGRATWLTGPRWHPVRPAFRDVPRHRPARAEVGRVLLLSGGSDLHGFSHTAREAARLAFPNADIDMVIGPGAAGYDNDFAFEHTTLHRRVNAASMRSLMQAADLAVSAAGQTLYELALCGCPTVAVGLADNQARNLREWSALGAAVTAGWHHDADLADKLKATLIALAAPDLRQRASDAGQAAIDGRGVERILRAALDDQVGRPDGA